MPHSSGGGSHGGGSHGGGSHEAQAPAYQGLTIRARDAI